MTTRLSLSALYVSPIILLPASPASPAAASCVPPVLLVVVIGFLAHSSGLHAFSRREAIDPATASHLEKDSSVAQTVSDRLSLPGMLTQSRNHSDSH